MNKVLDFVAQYYNEKIKLHGHTPQGADWNGADSQRCRFRVLTQLINKTNFSLNDLGCGYGAFYQYLLDRRDLEWVFTYNGADVASQMIAAARSEFSDFANCSWYHDGLLLPLSDFSVASGIFNVRGNISDSDWDVHISNTLNLLNEKSVEGFAFNMLTNYSDTDRLKPNLRYCDPCYYFDYCKRVYGRNVALLHDYGLYEFTIIVRKG